MTSRVVFYDIGPEQRPALAAKMALGAWDKKKVLVLKCAEDELAWLDEHLWTFREEVFLPHEAWRPGADLHDPEARVVLVCGDESPLAADILVQLAPAGLDFARRFETVIDVVDHRDELRLAASRARYKAWTDLGLRPDLKKTF